MKVIPSILEKDSSSLFFQIERLSPFFKTFQIDIADGIFVQNKTLDIGNVISAMKQFNNETISNLLFDFHLMVNDYLGATKKLSNLVAKKLLSIKNVFIHFSLFPNYSLLTTTYPQFTFGLVLNPEDSLDKLYKLYNFKTINCIQIMSVSPGSQGSPFLPETLQKIQQLRKIGYKNSIFLDGGINDKSLLQIMNLEFKPDFLVVGSYLTKSSNLQEKIDSLKSLGVA
ncbi:hypothetical protein A3C98_00305 [Candidatus Roizmanbacteria bacterium RIFCSPHIGHO2_02_FULL_37_15]|nr:MAG: hypothetical protein A3C98_00305 [Candidatus Roizmanbacteria bacterium RIFCSPHIGHO2_02_FULL_37_15]